MTTLAPSPPPRASEQRETEVIDVDRSDRAADQDPFADDRLFSVLFVTAAGLLEAGWVAALFYFAVSFL